MKTQTKRKPSKAVRRKLSRKKYEETVRKPAREKARREREDNKYF